MHRIHSFFVGAFKTIQIHVYNTYLKYFKLKKNGIYYLILLWQMEDNAFINHNYFTGLYKRVDIIDH